MRKIKVSSESFQYDIYIGSFLTDLIEKELSTTFKRVTKIMIVCDETISRLYLESFLEVVRKHKETVVQIVPSGEKAKTFSVFEKCISTAIQEGLDRHSLIIAFGGGAVGDVAGFVAATFMRGIRYVQIPTTLLAHDSAVGGKTAINHPLGKNMVGAFHQPEAVYYDLNFLKTLPIRERLSGFAELIKHGLIGDRTLLNVLIENVKSIDFQDLSFWEEVIEKGIKVKARIVEQDAEEKNIRALLNFGHTLGHAIENLSQYSISHGEAVLKGMVFALGVSEDKHTLMIPSSDLVYWFRQLGYDTTIPASMSIGELIEQMKRDKKSIGGAIQFILLKQIEQPYETRMDDTDLVRYLEIART